MTGQLSCHECSILHLTTNDAVVFTLTTLLYKPIERERERNRKVKQNNEINNGTVVQQ